MIAGTAHTKSVHSASVSTSSPPPTVLKLSRESHWTPQGWVPLKSGAIMRPIIADVARKRQSAFRRCRQRFCIFVPVFCGVGGSGVVFVRSTRLPGAGGP